jgi:hypothetical protein
MATCNPSTLIANASQFTSLPPGAQRIARLSLLTSILKARKPSFVLDINSLLANASGFQSLSEGEIRLARLQLYCEVLGGIS